RKTEVKRLRLFRRAELARFLDEISARAEISPSGSVNWKSLKTSGGEQKQKELYPALPPPPERAAGATGRGWTLGKLRRKFPGWLKFLCGGLATIAGPWTTPTAILVSP